MKATKTFKSMRELRNTPVRDLTPEECRKLTVHNHGQPVDPLRRKAYILKGNPGRESAYFKPAEQVTIESAIAEGI
jgi:hypothetical protein